MRMSTKGRYGVRVMIELGLRVGEGPVSAASIARCQGISKKYMHSLLARLAAAGLVHSIRGSKGGYTLAKPPSRISARDIIDALEGPFRPVRCSGSSTVCRRTRRCAARGLWQDMEKAVENVLTTATLERLTSTQSAMDRRDRRRA